MQYAKYYGNIRAGNLAKDREMVIKSYQTKVRDLTETMTVDNSIAENYKNEISSFYDSYKEAGLYNQASRVQSDVNASNNRDEDVLEDYDVEEHINTYDNIVLSYADRASAASDARHTIDYYNKIIDSYTNDKVAAETKERLAEKNEEIFKEIAQYSEKYCTVANQTINEMFYTEINDDLQYLILPEVTADKPVKLIAVFVTVLVFGLLLVAALLYELTKRVAATANAANEGKNEKLQIDTSGMSRLHQLVYEQYTADFKDFYLVYQPMKGGGENDREHLEALIRWRSDELGMVSPAKLIECIADFGIFPQLNDWIIKNVCADIFYIAKEKGRAPIVHINCPSGQLSDFALNDIII
ncbi:MAG TPA: EAL domain-containing protein [Candidatus Ornithomonoglobus intestinigallinarum]|uniref:EAL domain-containing protein n=1 Tax=Candidatus Ornithomonoglobus intestinigallinarum TaxID=2840894 RepID=A0A9D1H1Z4_9FIRM|nr:EAL domain-containing protein [Candidatus Ornithomonoglobus intestinigallinarum]